MATKNPLGFDPKIYVAMFVRRRRMFVIAAVTVFVLGILLTLTLPKVYTATADVLLDQRKENVVNVQQVMSDAPTDQFSTDTEVEVLKSRDLTEKVTAKLALDNDPFFNKALPQPGAVGQAKQAVFGALHTVRALLPSTPVDPAVAQQVSHQRVIDAVQKNLRITRSGLTYMIDVSFPADGPDKGAAIATAFADKYLLEQLHAKFVATQRENDWLNSRLAGLRDQVQAAEAAVEQYRAANGLLTGDNNNTLTQQEVSNLDTELASAKAAEAEQNAKLSAAQTQLAQGSNGEDLGEALNSNVIQQLRAQRAQLSGQVADLESRYGPRHPELLRAKSQLSDIDKQIQAEIHRIISNLEAQQQVAHQRTASLASSEAQSRGTLAANSTASVRLNEPATQRRRGDHPLSIVPGPLQADQFSGRHRTIRRAGDFPGQDSHRRQAHPNGC